MIEEELFSSVLFSLSCSFCVYELNNSWSKYGKEQAGGDRQDLLICSAKWYKNQRDDWRPGVLTRSPFFTLYTDLSLTVMSNYIKGVFHSDL